jgi:hypothetical protein
LTIALSQFIYKLLNIRGSAAAISGGAAGKRALCR